MPLAAVGKKPCAWRLRRRRLPASHSERRFPGIMTKSPNRIVDSLSPLERNRIARPKECEKLSGVSWDSLKRARPDAVVQISERCVGMRVADVLQLKD